MEIKKSRLIFIVFPSALFASSPVKVPLLRPVDLRLLQLVRVIHVHRLPLRVEINRADTAFAMAVAGGFGAAEGQVYFGADCRSVDVGDAGVEVANGGEGLVHVFGVNRGRKSVLDALCALDANFHLIPLYDPTAR